MSCCYLLLACFFSFLCFHAYIQYFNGNSKPNRQMSYYYVAFPWIQCEFWCLLLRWLFSGCLWRELQYYSDNSNMLPNSNSNLFILHRPSIYNSEKKIWLINLIFNPHFRFLFLRYACIRYLIRNLCEIKMLVYEMNWWTYWL